MEIADTADARQRLRRHVYRIIFTAFFAWLALLGARYAILAQANIGDSIGERLRFSCVAGKPDLVVVCCLAFAALLVVLLTRRRRSGTVMVAIWQLILAAVVLAGYGNVMSIRFLGEPFTYQWLLYSDFL